MDIGFKIRELRKKNSITQDRLSQYLGISSQAISKWENGTALPDITLVPKLSSFFGVSTDELFSINPEITDKKLLEYKEKAREFKKVFDYESVARLMEQALEEYPSNYEFMWELVHAYSHRQRKNRELDKIIPLCERIVEDCRDETLRHCAIQMLCISYADNGQRKEALNLINTLPDEPVEKSWLLEMVLEGEEKIEQSQRNLISCVEWVVAQLIMLSSDSVMGNELSFDEKIHFAESALTIYTTIFSDGHKAPNNGAFRHIYERLSELYLGKGDKENGIKYLQLAAESAMCYDKYATTEITYSPIFINRCKIERGTNHYIDTVRLLQLIDMRKIFDLVRDTNEFKDIYKQLQDYVYEK